MHETALAQGVADILADEARKAGARAVRKVRLTLGALSHVDADALAFSLDVATRGGPAEGAELLIDRPSGEAFCMGCGDTVPILRRGDPCPVCGGSQLLVTGGDQLQVTELEVI